jgi:threonine synthase
MTHEQSGQVTSTWIFVCQSCATTLAFGPEVYGCPACRTRGAQGLLELHRQSGTSSQPEKDRVGRGLSRYLDLLPVADPHRWISLGEGGTALVRSTAIGPRLGFQNLYFKLEQQNPTLSFKDRFVAVTVNAARSFGYRRVAVSSTGNLGLSVAAYGAALGMDCVFIAPRGTPAGIIDEANLYGARVAVMDKSIRFQALERLIEYRDWFPVGLFMNRPIQNPFGIEGYKTFAYETISELGEAPAAMLFPSARGNGLYGAWKGFEESMQLGWSASLPRMIACQPEGSNSLQVSLERHSPIALEVPPVESIAKSTAETLSSDSALRSIRLSNGTALTATEAEIKDAVVQLGREGISVEAGAALTVACLPRLRAALDLDPQAAVVCVLTATGLRWPEQLRWGGRHAVEINTLNEFAKLLES